MGKYAMLVDQTRCTGCRACQVACKQWNDLPGERTRNRGTYTNPPALSANTWNLIEFKEIQSNGKSGFYFLRRACMHCEHPACASVCLVGALQKTKAGPVVYDDSKCIGCRYCMTACPFGVPTFQWDKGFLDAPVIRKCQLCADRISNGMQPACAKTCPAKVIQFGDRDKLIAEAKVRIKKNPERYVDHVYGEQEGGGTSILYLSAVPFEMLGLPKLGNDPVTAFSEKVMEWTLPFAAVWTSALAGIALLVRFRTRAARHAAASQEKEEA